MGMDPRVRQLRTVPHVGPVTAAAFVAAIDDVARFLKRPVDKGRRFTDGPTKALATELGLSAAGAPAGKLEGFEVAEVETAETSIFACRSRSGPPLATTS